jgi:hypothetical protein
MEDFTDITITAILTAAIKEIVSLVSLTIKKYIINRKWEFKITFLKMKGSSNDNYSSVYHPNTPFTFDENHNFVGH